MEYTSLEHKLHRLKCFGYFYIGWAGIYWVWAIVNTFHTFPGWDKGCATFFAVLLTMVLLFFHVIPKVERSEKIALKTLLLFPVAQCAVVLNYMFPAISLMGNVDSHAFKYLSSFTILWFISAIFSFLFLLKYTAAVGRINVQSTSKDGRAAEDPRENLLSNNF